MKKVAVIGANGQVGAELCLLLAGAPGVELVPVCRTVSGSAFLRRHGIAVRHGSVAQAADARRLLGDCDLVVNAALAAGTPREMRSAEDAIIGNALRAAAPGARVVHFSTQSVYGDPRPGRWLRTLNPYGRAKRGTERTARAVASQERRELYVLRLGHVCGALQNISQELRHMLAAGPVPVPARDVASNTVYTVTLLDALLAISDGRVAPGVYDLMNAPQLTWREVLAEEARIAGDELALAVAAESRAGRNAWLRARFGGLRRLATSEAARNLASALLAHAPARLNARARARWLVMRARREISALARPAVAPPEHFSWRANGSRWIAALTPTRQLLARAPYQGLLDATRAAWPADLADAPSAPTPEVAGLRSTAT